MNRRSTSPRLSLVLVLALVCTSPAPASFAQGRSGSQRRVTASRPRPEIARMLREVDARNIERTLRELVSFGTRNTLSLQDYPARGERSDRDWFYREKQSYSRDSAEHFKLELQIYYPPEVQLQCR